MIKKTIKLNFDEVKLKKDVKKIILNEGQEEILVELLKAQAEIEKAIKELGEAIGEAGLKLDPSFRGIKNDRFSFMYRVYGSRFMIDPNYDKSELPDGMVKKTVKYVVNSGEVEKYLDEVGELPSGIVERERSRVPSLRLVGEKEEDDND